MDIRSTFAAQGYAEARPATAPQPGDGPMGAMELGIADFAMTFAETDQIATDTMTTGSDPQALVEALAQTQLAVDTVVAVRTRVVEAYQEILRMPV